MEKNIKKDNALIKQSGLLALMKKEGIRAGHGALSYIGRAIEGEVKAMLPALKEEMFAHGRKTLKPEDVKAILEKKAKEEAWEV